MEESETRTQGFPGHSVVKNPPEKKEMRFDPWVGKIPWKRAQQPIPEADLMISFHSLWDQLHSRASASQQFPSYTSALQGGSSLVAQMIKNLPAMQDMWVQSLGWEDPLEKGMATHSSILAWRIPWIEESVQLQSMGLQSRT